MAKTYLKGLIGTSIALFIFILFLGASYTWWNTATPDKTCARCHEIHSSHSSWTSSAHSEISCLKCHGTALENGFKSLSEKSRMVVRHFLNKPDPDDIRLSEEQILGTMERCRSCHQGEYAGWLAGGHSATYADIMLDETHNTAEQLNFDCLRCHGMFYEGTILDLVEPISKQGPWRMKDEKMAGKATIPCMACHMIHSKGEPAQRPDYSTPENVFYRRMRGNNALGFYFRHEKTHFTPDDLPKPVILSGKDTVQTPADPVYRLCVQCHAPSVWHQAGSSDDHTPAGVHEGISCMACHEPHSNYQKNSCDKCHAGKSKNCRLDVRTMNTTYFSPSSKNDVHTVACTDCHEQM